MSDAQCVDIEEEEGNMSVTKLILGDRNAICDVCGFRFKASQLMLRWDGARVCSDDFETRHPQDFQRIPRGESSPSWTRAEPQENFTSPNYVASTVGVQE